MAATAVPDIAADAVLVTSEEMPAGAEKVQGYDFNTGIDHHKILQSYKYSGFQATNFGLAVEQINKMIEKREEEIPEDKIENCRDGFPVVRNNCTIFLGYTSNMASCGVRETLRFLAQHNMVDCIVTTAGGVEGDFIKCLAPTFIGDFALPGKQLREKGINRIGNLLVPNNNYVKFEDWLMPKLDKMLDDQEKNGVN
jgi:deoxyhypusine synthase